jgi:hypothetical protein
MKDLLIWGGGALVAYYLYSNFISGQGLVISPLGVGASLPTANIQGNEFNCPKGTKYYDFDTSSSSGGGYCE